MCELDNERAGKSNDDCMSTGAFTPSSVIICTLDNNGVGKLIDDCMCRD